MIECDLETYCFRMLDHIQPTDRPKGIGEILVINSENPADRISYPVIRKREHAAGIQLNFCPFCGRPFRGRHRIAEALSRKRR